MVSKKILLLVVVIFFALVVAWSVSGAGPIKAGAKAQPSNKTEATREQPSSERNGSPLYAQALTNTIDELEAKNGASGTATPTAPASTPVDKTRRGATYDITTYWTCIVSCSLTCAFQTCSGSECGGPTISDTTCSGTCDTTCSSDCNEPPPPSPPPQPKTTSRYWGHDSVGSAWIATEWYLAEGCTANGFETWILVQNPQDASTTVHLTYMTPTGPVTGPSATLPAYSRKSFNVADTVPNCAEVSTKVTTDGDTSYVTAERAMYGPGRAWGHNSIGTFQPAPDWYLAEGCTAGGFETWVLVQNPNSSAANVKLTYMTPSGPVTGPAARLPANSRKSFFVADSVANCWEVSTQVASDSNVVAERAVYWNNRKGGHESIGVSETNKTWYLAEGSTAGGFETFVLVQNPGNSSASVDLQFMTDSGSVTGPHLNLPARSRKTVNVADYVPGTWSVSTKVTSSNNPVIAERSVYWNNRVEGHDSIGVTEPAAGWVLAEGSTGPGFETWILIQNPSGSDANVTITYMTPTGSVTGPSDVIPAHSRKSYNVADTLLGEAEISTSVGSDVPVIAERAMYGDPK